MDLTRSIERSAVGHKPAAFLFAPDKVARIEEENWMPREDSNLN